MNERLIKKLEDRIEKLLQEDENLANIEYLYKLVKTNHIAKEDKNMNYGNYNGYGNYGNYGRPGYNAYGRRGYDMKYRGYDHMDRISNDYGRYMDSRERYGANEETNKAFEYMAHSAGDFIKYLFEEAETPQQKQMLRETIQSRMM